MSGIKKCFAGVGRALLLTAAVTLAACDTSELLEVNDPDLVVPENITGEKGAELLWAGAIGEFAQAYSSGGGGQIVYVGMFTDEFHLSGTFPTRNEVDRRNVDERNGTMTGQYRQLHRARVAAENAADALAEFAASGDSRVAELLSLAGFTYVMFGENYCSGVPYGSTPRTGEPVEGQPTTSVETFNLAVARFDAALAATAGSSAQQNLARVGKARALLNLGRYDDAAAAVSGVPTDFEYQVRSKGGGAFNQRNAIYELNSSQRRWSVSEGEGGNGIAFRSLNDPRVQWTRRGSAVGFDEETPLFEQLKYDSWDSDVVLASGIEARLIEAEAMLRGGNAAGALGMLNTLRSRINLPPLADAGTPNARVDQLFDEKALWLYATAHRLGDLRRLVRQYSRDAASVFPTGPFFKGGSYGSDVNFIIPFVERENPNFNGCLDRNP